jgi:mRNA interferase HigB
VLSRYPKADFPGKSHAIFNICGNKYRVLTLINYKSGIVLVSKAGTHKEYEEWNIG